MPKIDDHDFGRIVVDGLEQTRDVILLPGRVVLNWWRQDGHRCSTTSRLRANNDREMVRKQVLPKPAPSLTTHVLHRRSSPRRRDVPPWAERLLGRPSA
jgi:hypothetical protein